MRACCVIFAVLVFLAASSAHPQSTPVCTTHFYNQSNFQWNIYNFDGKKDTLFIPPNTTMAINWGTTSVITISGNMPNNLFKQQFSVQQANSCVVIQASGSNWPVSLNKPGNGDITTCAGGC
jgi:hypothetical protein